MCVDKTLKNIILKNYKNKKTKNLVTQPQSHYWLCQSQAWKMRTASTH